MSPREPRSEVPPPADPHRRREPLPGQHPKPPHEDPEALRKLERILRSPSYLLAEDDPELLRREDTRGVRLQLDYMKAELLLREHAVEHTIVVFGSTRIPDPEAAARRVEALGEALERQPADELLRRRLAVAERLQAKSSYYEVARRFSRLVSEWHDGPGGARLVIATGGGPGVMEAANRGAHDAGAANVGFNIDLPHEQYPNPYITPRLCFRFHYFAMRKLHLLSRARALVAFPGGYGTLDELFETLTLVQTRKIAPVPVVLVGTAYWRRAFDVDFLVDEGTIDPEDRELFWTAETPEEIWEGIRCWYQQNGRALFGPR